MNERIRQLAEQAKMFATPMKFHLGGQDYAKVRDEKFAELIVGECVATIANDTANYPGEGMMSYYQGVQDAVKSIRKHFGVEE